jgi:ankyrin repeat protein
MILQFNSCTCWLRSFPDCHFIPIGLDVIEAQLKACPEAAKVQHHYGNTLLYLGVEEGANVVVIRALLDACPDVTTMKDDKGNTPLHLGMKVRAWVEILSRIHQVPYKQ